MVKRFSLVIISLLSILFVNAQLKSPAQFLGYEPGSRYTPHWKVLDYYRHVAESVPGMVKLQSYGKTYEGRELMVAFISSAGNISDLENIRVNNLALAKMSEGGSPRTSPVIVWLSYNVHGNETSSSEAAMVTLYSLVDPSGTEIRTWLNNAVVVMDPCLNPDGRDRYVNWFNSVIGTRYDPAPEAREHREPWPGGRTNHYNHDLNRDWAWQTQVESQQRMELYQQWMPQIHVDFHEQGVNNPYYFAPAAQPYHEAITQWQRDFQFDIGRNHAGYFDKEGWLYFTREVFDLLYPSYGDTYPIFNGGIGMTYEQAGGPAGGAAVLTEMGDTLTLLDRIQHHHTTALSTIEVSAKNAGRIVTEFRKYFENAVNGKADQYHAYVIRYADMDRQRLEALTELLQKNRIQYGSGKAGNYKGYNYHTGKEESFSLSKNDLVISTHQPKAALVRVLFEPSTVVVDSVTYDITAWALPYAFGLTAYACRDRIEVTPAATSSSRPITQAENSFGYIIPWSGVQSVKLVSRLLQQGIRLRMSEQPFVSGGHQFQRGAVIVLRTSNQQFPDLMNQVRALASEYEIELTPVQSGFVDKGYDFGSSRVRPLLARKIALITGEGVNSNAAGEVWHFFDQQINYPVTLINQNDFSRVNWSDYDVIILPDGNFRFLNDKTQADQFRTWIQNGGHVVALEGAVSQLARQDWGLKSKKAEEDTEDAGDYNLLRRYEDRERDFIQHITPGSIFRVELDQTHPLAFGYPGYYYTLKYNDNIYEFIREGGWNVGVIKQENQVAGFVGSRVQNRLKDGLLFGVQDMGRGTITYLAENVLFRSFWENGKLMFSNAVFVVGQ